jgi:hypothetical protein
MEPDPSEPVPPTTTPQSNISVTSNTKNLAHHLGFGLVSLAIVILAASTVYLWQHQKVNSLNEQIANMQLALKKSASISLDNLTARLALPNIVADSANSPTDLIAFLATDNTQCYKNDGGSGYYKVMAQDNDLFAKMDYGCTAKGGSTPLDKSPAYILAKKTNNKWSLISPTNQWLVIADQQVPSCKMVNDNKVSKLITPQCWQGPGLLVGGANAARTVVEVTNP